MSIFYIDFTLTDEYSFSSEISVPVNTFDICCIDIKADNLTNIKVEQLIYLN